MSSAGQRRMEGAEPMKIIISPAKQMGEARDFLAPRGRPVYEDRAAELAEHLQGLSYPALKGLLSCGDALARAAYENYQTMDLARADTPAILAYQGIQYRYMAPQVFEEPCFDYVQAHLRIFSGLYGILRPLDAVVPYRLEMGARVRFGPWRDLYHFWGESLYRALTEDGDRTILNLASREYSRAVTPYLTAGDTFVTCVFGEVTGGRVVEKGVYVKMARGEMVRWMAERAVEGVEGLRAFDRLGFAFCPARSTPDRLVFLMERRP